MQSTPKSSGAIGTVYTVGYAGRGIEEVKQILDLTGAILADIRYRPYGRLHEWNKQALMKAMGDSYVHVPELGNANYRLANGPIRLADATEGMRKIGSYLEAGRDVVLLCVCYDVRVCHRKLVAEMLADKFGCVVDHVRHKLGAGAQKAKHRQPCLFG